MLKIFNSLFAMALGVILVPSAFSEEAGTGPSVGLFGIDMKGLFDQMMTLLGENLAYIIGGILSVMVVMWIVRKISIVGRAR